MERIIDSRPVDSSLAPLIGNSYMDMQLLGTAPLYGYALPIMALGSWYTGNEARGFSFTSQYAIGRSSPCLASITLMPTGSNPSCSMLPNSNFIPVQGTYQSLRGQEMQ